MASTYTLYLRGIPAMRRLSKDEKAEWEHSHGFKAPDRVVEYGSNRHHAIETFDRYHRLVARAKQLCVELNWPKTRWMEIFDWNV